MTTLFESAQETVQALVVQLHERITGVDGTYDFDGTARYEMAGMEFLVLIEGKRHKNPIKRELVQVLHSKLQSVGAHKAVMVSTAPYQSGALEFALTHGIALVTVTEGRFTYETKSVDNRPSLSREHAREWFGIPTFVDIAIARRHQRDPSRRRSCRPSTLRMLLSFSWVRPTP